MAGAIGPAIGLGGSIFSAINAKKSRGPADAAGTSMDNTLGQLRGQSTTMFNTGLPMTQNAGGYFNTLLRGSRPAMSQATAGPAAQITDTYRGANASLERMGVRGGEAATSRAELARDQAAKVAGLTTGIQPMAAGALAAMGSGATEQGQRGLTSAEEGYGNLQKNRLDSQKQSFGQNQDILGGFGKAISELLKPGTFSKGGGGQNPNTGQVGQPGYIPPTVTPTPGYQGGNFNPNFTPDPNETYGGQLPWQPPYNGSPTGPSGGDAPGQGTPPGGGTWIPPDQWGF